jgi:hypothetical protein
MDDDPHNLPPEQPDQLPEGIGWLLFFAAAGSAAALLWLIGHAVAGL